MGKPFKALVAGGIIGGIAWAYREYELQQQRDAQPRIMPAVAAPTADKSNPFRDLIADNLSGILGGVFDELRGSQTAPQSPTAARSFGAVLPTNTPASQQRSGRGIDGLLRLIGSVEAPRGFDQISGFITREHYPPKRITRMTVNEVIAWQHEIDRFYNTGEAAGQYQFIKETLAKLVSLGLVDGNALFNAATQKAAAIARMRQRRRLDEYLAGTITPEQFGFEIAREWASMPAIIKDKRGRPAQGQSYYAGDGINKAHVTIPVFMAAIRRI